MDMLIDGAGLLTKAFIGCAAIHGGSAFLAATAILPTDPLIASSNALSEVMVQAIA